MRTDVAGWLGLVVVGLSAGGAVAQPERYELGQRLKRFEQAWEEQRDPAARKKALTIVKKATGQFLSLQLGEAGRTLDEARYALLREPVSDSARWADALYLVPEKRLVDASQGSLRFDVRTLYQPHEKRPADLRARAEFASRMGFWGSLVVGQQGDFGFIRRPYREVRLDRATGTGNAPFLDWGVPVDWHCDASFEGKDGPLRSDFFRRGFIVSAVPGLLSRVAVWRTLANTAPTTLESATVADRARLFLDLADGSHPETDVPVARLLDETGTMAQLALAGKPYFTPDRPGDFRLAVPTGKNVVTPCRLLVPKGLSRDKPVPLVVALHGAGGSENLFFEGYGNGHIVKECEKRGWMLLAPRSGLIGAAPVAAIIDKLAERYPIDSTRVFLVGHSMGAGQAVELVQQHTGKFAAVATLGGAGRVRKKEVFADLPVFVGVGDQDFALKGSRALHQALTDAGAKRVTYKEYPDLEHLVIVREALPDVFAAWDAIAKK